MLRVFKESLESSKVDIDMQCVTAGIDSLAHVRDYHHINHMLQAPTGHNEMMMMVSW